MFVSPSLLTCLMCKKSYLTLDAFINSFAREFINHLDNNVRNQNFQSILPLIKTGRPYHW